MFVHQVRLHQGIMLDKFILVALSAVFDLGLFGSALAGESAAANAP
jgi:hypothetical protein